MWLAPNLVTLLGFFFILGNIVLLEVYIPDLVGPVSSASNTFGSRGLTGDCMIGTVMGILQLCIWHVDVGSTGGRFRVFADSREGTPPWTM